MTNCPYWYKCTYPYLEVMLSLWTCTNLNQTKRVMIGKFTFISYPVSQGQGELRLVTKSTNIVATWIKLCVLLFWQVQCMPEERLTWRETKQVDMHAYSWMEHKGLNLEEILWEPNFCYSPLVRNGMDQDVEYWMYYFPRIRWVIIVAKLVNIPNAYLGIPLDSWFLEWI